MRRWDCHGDQVGLFDNDPVEMVRRDQRRGSE